MAVLTATIDNAIVEVEAVDNETRSPSIPVVSGEDVTVRVTVRNADGGTVVNISTYTTINFEAFLLSTGASAFSGTGTLVSSGTGGQFTMAIDRADTVALAGAYRFEVEVIGTSYRNTLIQGLLSVIPTYA